MWIKGHISNISQIGLLNMLEIPPPPWDGSILTQKNKTGQVHNGL